MATQIIMDHNGDTPHNFDAKDVKAILEAERRFKALTVLASLRQPVYNKNYLPAADGRARD